MTPDSARMATSAEALDTKINEAARLLRNSQRLVVLMGAGVSKESGVPTFRDALTGLWAAFDPTQLATVAAFRANPKLVWDWYASRRTIIEAVTFNPAHQALADLETLLSQVVIVTQNIDGLHQRAGSRDVIPLHGAIHQYKCLADCRGAPTLVNVVVWNDLPAVPRCPHCGEFLRPNIVWFGEYLPAESIARATALCHAADVVLIVGTSGVVEPAASLPWHAKHYANAAIIDVNPTDDEFAVMADVFLEAPAGSTLPRVIAAMRAL